MNRARTLHLALVVIGLGFVVTPLAVPPDVPDDRVQYRIVEEFELNGENPPEFAYREFSDTERQVFDAALAAGDGSHNVSPAAAPDRFTPPPGSVNTYDVRHEGFWRILQSIYVTNTPDLVTQVLPRLAVLAAGIGLAALGSYRELV